MALYFVARSGYKFGEKWPGTKVASHLLGTDEFIAWHASVGSGVSTVPMAFGEVPAALVTGVLDLYVTNSLDTAKGIAVNVAGASIFDVSGNLLGSTPPADVPLPAPIAENDEFSLIVRKSAGIEEPSDLSGLTIAVVGGAAIERAVTAYFTERGLAFEIVMYTNALSAAANDYRAGLVDAIAGDEVTALIGERLLARIEFGLGYPDGSGDYRILDPFELDSVPVTDTPADDHIVGGDGDDIFHHSDGNDFIYGGPGTDTMVYTGMSRQDVSVEVRSGSTVLVSKQGGGVDTLTSIERLEFSDGTLAFDLDGNAGQAYRLYQAAFDRVPDTEGLSYWISRLDSGTTSLNAVAESFLHSPEFVRTYGTEQTVSNSQFVELLYLHTLGRDYDQSGFDYWVERLDGGHTNRADLLAFFSESDENVARVAPAIQDGIWFV